MQVKMLHICTNDSIGEEPEGLLTLIRGTRAMWDSVVSMVTWCLAQSGWLYVQITSVILGVALLYCIKKPRSEEDFRAELLALLQRDDAAGLRRWLKKGVDVNHIWVSGAPMKPLHWCCMHSKLKCAKLLLENGADPNTMAAENLSSPLFYATLKQDAELVKLLLDHGSNVALRDRWGATALHMAVQVADNEACLALLLEAARERDRHMEDFYACMSASWRRSLLSDSDIPLVNMGDQKGKTPLLDAILNSGTTMEQCLVYVDLLLQAEADPNLPDTSNLYPLGAAVCHSSVSLDPAAQERLVHFLVSAGANINCLSSSWPHRYFYRAPPLSHAISVGNTDMVALLLSLQADPDTPNAQGGVPITLAATCGSLECCRLLINRKCNLNRRTDSRHIYRHRRRKFGTPLVHALYSKQWQIAKLLVLAGCDLTLERYLHTGMFRPARLMKNLPMWMWMKHRVILPWKLQELCRLSIRTTLACPMDDSIEKLPLPPLLKRYLLFYIEEEFEVE